MPGTCDTSVLPQQGFRNMTINLPCYEREEVMDNDIDICYKHSDPTQACLAQHGTVGVVQNSAGRRHLGWYGLLAFLEGLSFWLGLYKSGFTRGGDLRSHAITGLLEQWNLPKSVQAIFVWWYVGYHAIGWRLFVFEVWCLLKAIKHKYIVLESDWKKVLL